MAVVFPSENRITQQLPSLRRNPAYTEGRVISDKISGRITTLHRERELNVLVAGDSSDEDEELKSKPRTVTSPVEYGQPNRQLLCVSQSNPIPSQNSRSSPLLSQNPSSPLPISQYEKRLLAAKQVGKMPPPNYMDIPWFHPQISRHVAESILLSKRIPNGTYLLRDSSKSNSTVTLSVRHEASVKHYRITWDGKNLCFGLGRFKNIPEFLHHFASQPIISGESGLLVYIKHPYPRNVSEFVDYEEALFTEGVDILGRSLEPTQAPTFSINSKEGFLTKLGLHRKNWKLRWFKLYKNRLAYYASKDSTTPKNVIDLSQAMAVEREFDLNKDFCFRLVTTNRTFYMYAQAECEANEWVAILRWKLQHEEPNSP